MDNFDPRDYLRDYQKRCLKHLGEYLRLAGKVGAQAAFDTAACDCRPLGKDDRRARYAPAPGWPESAACPFVCLRVPTGGGKTVMAAYAVGIATRAFLQAERSMVLWLAPSNTIVEQTLRALRDRRNAYRQALDEAFGGCVTVLSVDEALAVKPGTLDVDTTVIVATMQTFRVKAKEGRLVYRGNGDLLDHFMNLSPAEHALLERTDDEGNPVPADEPGGTAAKSLANVFRLRRPLVIVDEAHNAKSDLSYDTLGRFSPSAIIEFTATPAAHTKKTVGSNVLCSVSAAELKAAKMIKLPIRLVDRPNPKEAVAAALAKREELERLAVEQEGAGGDYVRPIVLFQAQSEVGEDPITPAVLREWLIDEFDIPEEQIAVRTGKVDELPDEPLRRDCPLRYVITINALREGWDCPFAYVLCSVSNLSARTAVEQILGRILRMPYAQQQKCEALNQAYAYATSPGFHGTAESLRDALVETGFERYEAESAVTPGEGAGGATGPEGNLWGQPIAEPITAEPDPAALAALPKEVREAVSIERPPGTGGTEIVWRGGLMLNHQAAALARAFQRPEDRRAIEKIKRRSEGRNASPADFGDEFRVPRLAVPDPDAPGGWSLFDPGGLDPTWTLAECDARLGPDVFSPTRRAASGADIDVEDGGRFRIRTLEKLEERMQLRDQRGPKTAEQLVDWLDAEIDTPEATQGEKRAFLDRVVTHLLIDRSMTMEQLAPARWRLSDAVVARITSHRLRARASVYQAMLLGDARTPVESRPEVVFEFPMRVAYPVRTRYEGPLEFKKHYYAVRADMDPEEARCAALIDSHPAVEFWVRNLTQGPFAFSLPLVDGNFYPDFVVRLKDGRIAAVEYKGADRRSNDDSKAKDQIGRLWAARSAGRTLFAMVGQDDMEARLEDLFAPA